MAAKLTATITAKNDPDFISSPFELDHFGCDLLRVVQVPTNNFFLSHYTRLAVGIPTSSLSEGFADQDNVMLNVPKNRFGSAIHRNSPVCNSS
jgi:hypothetical protein